ncbi:hypothetical protein MMC34_004219 [Xylographa carneopallida]|nr:hypothetical protein [Xylographa carneopallida]
MIADPIEEQSIAPPASAPATSSPRDPPPAPSDSSPESSDPSPESSDPPSTSSDSPPVPSDVPSDVPPEPRDPPPAPSDPSPRPSDPPPVPDIAPPPTIVIHPSPELPPRPIKTRPSPQHLTPPTPRREPAQPSSSRRFSTLKITENSIAVLARYEINKCGVCGGDLQEGQEAYCPPCRHISHKSCFKAHIKATRKAEKKLRMQCSICKGPLQNDRESE